MPSQDASVDIAIIKHLPPVRNIFSNFIQIFSFYEPIEKWKWNYIDMNSNQFNIIMKFEM